MDMVGRLHHAIWRAFQHGQLATAKAAAYSSILALFPAFLVVTSILEASHETERFVRQIAAAVGWALTHGPNSIAISFFQSGHHQTGPILLSAATVTLLAASGVMTSWMEGFRKAYGVENTWGFWKEQGVALYLVFLALIPLSVATVLVAFGNQIEG